MAIALKEANETEYGILLLRETNYLTSQEADSILNDTKELLKLMTSIIKISDPEWDGDRLTAVGYGSNCGSI